MKRGKAKRDDRIRACYVEAGIIVRQAVTDLNYEEDAATAELLGLIKERIAICLVVTGADYSPVFHRDALDSVPDDVVAMLKS